ncbi:DUF2971 domain-containing protein [Burkholderia glumae]|uniref:DUF2971 domain-containing protein n=1 Tax=Burkholderia glumae TaxID=337 RepID=UPI002150E021|nr:DUF2971 domain-containing protein [Burkholderia glumae]
MPSSLPTTYDLFKFKPVSEYLLDSLRKSSIWFARPDGLNDPFDCQIDLRATFSRALKKTIGEKRNVLLAMLSEPNFLDNWEAQFSKVGVCSFTLDHLNGLMWAHYANDHRGVCLLYRFPEKFFITPTNKIIGVDKVRYGDDTVTDWLVDAELDDIYQLRTELTKVYLTAKAPDWSYEKEIRVIRFNHGLFEIPPESLIQVCFGMRTSEKDITLVKDAANVHGLPVTYCQIVRDEHSDFGLTAVEI